MMPSSSSRLFMVIVMTCLMACLAACDFLAKQADLQEVVVDLSLFKMKVKPDSSFAVSIPMDIRDRDLPDIFDVTAVYVNPDEVSYTPNTPDDGRSCVLSAIPVVNGYPTTFGEITISNGTIASVSPNRFEVGAFTEQQVTQVFSSIPEDERPTLAEYEGKGVQRIVNASVGSRRFHASFMFRHEGDCLGSLIFQRVIFSLDF